MTTRELLQGSLSGVAATSAAAGPGADSPTHAAWLRYEEVLREQRTRFFENEAARDPQLRAQGLYFLQSQQASAFNLYVAPRQQYPALYVQSIFMPFELSWGMPNPDFLNHNGFIDGAHTYRIYGNRRGNDWATLQVFRGFWGDDVQGNLGNVDFDDVPTAPDGSFEIFLGPRPAEGDGKYWVPLDPEVRNVMLAMRETFYDWTNDKPMEVHIEVLDRDPNAPIYFDETELAARLEKARKWVEASFQFAMTSAKRLLGQHNSFEVVAGARQQGGSPLGHWMTMLYDIEPDEALIVDMPAAKARYWGLQLGSVWGQTTDYSYHQSSINCRQAQLDSDGRFRAVIALHDPGVRNWLDPAGLLLRYLWPRPSRRRGCWIGAATVGRKLGSIDGSPHCATPLRLRPR